MKESLFSHLAYKFTSSPENIATEALCYIFNKSKTARKVLNNLLLPLGILLSENLTYETQVVGEDEAIPDLAGVNSESGIAEILFEVKFWAGLTENQPITYLRRMHNQGGKILIFICPLKRMNTLSVELERRIIEAEYRIIEKKNFDEGFISISIDNFPNLCVISWSCILGEIRKSIETEGNISVFADLIELQGLAERVEETAFIPFTSDNLTGSDANRIIQLCNIVDDLTELLVAKNIAVKSGLRATPLREGYGRYFIINKKHACMLQFNALWWRDILPTPIWISLQWIEGNDWVFPSRTKMALSFLENETPQRLFSTKRLIVIPLFIPYGVEKEGCIAALFSQLEPITSILKSINPL